MALRRVSNPPNPYESVHRDYLDEPPAASLEVYEETAASILSENDSPDLSFRYSVNPYRGCQHACAYCYARPTHEYLGYGAGSDFDSKIVVKTNAAALLDAALRRASWTRELIAFSGVTDCYQPIEAVYCVTRRCLEVCLAHANPCAIVTKSFLVARDADLLSELSRRAGSRVYVSIPFVDDCLARVIEPGAPTPTRRFDALRRLHRAGVPTGVMVAPLIPGLNDRFIAQVLERAADCGVDRAAYVPLRLPGSVKDVFLARLRNELPERARRVESLIRTMRGGRWNDPRFGARMTGAGAYWDSVRRLFETTARRLGLLERREPPPPTPTRAPGIVQLPLF